MSLSRKIATGITGLLSFLILALPVAVTAQSASNTSPELQQGLCAGVNFDAGSSCATSGFSQVIATQRLNELLQNVIRIFSFVVGFVSVIMIIYGGFKYITSGGDTGNITSARNTIVYALVGLVIVALSQLIVKFILTQLG